MYPTNEIGTEDLSQRFIEFIERTDLPVFLTGKAGTGKTTLLRLLVSRNFKNVLVCAPTGIAALNAGGVTLHSLLGLPPCTFIPSAFPSDIPEGMRIETPQSLARHLHVSAVKRKLLQNAQLMVIDEVSMLRADTLDAVDHILRLIRRIPKPFGGMQMLFIGDLMQLPPVIRNGEWPLLAKHYASPYFFDAKALSQQAPVRLELSTVHRQKDQSFAELLNRMRVQQLNEDDINLLNVHYLPGFEKKAISGTITLTTHNRIADTINENALASLETKTQMMPAKIQGEFPESMYPCERELKLKKGAQVMFIKNDLQQPQRFYNGKMGFVEEFLEDRIIIKTEEGSMVKLEPHVWENIRYTMESGTGMPAQEVIGSFSQYPLRLAWAITIHKSQGLTFDKAAIDVQNVFASGQCYVAFSRLRSLSGLTLLTPFTRKELGRDQALSRYENRPAETEQYFKQLEHYKRRYFSQSLRNVTGFLSLQSLLPQGQVGQDLGGAAAVPFIQISRAEMKSLQDKGISLLSGIAADPAIAIPDSVVQWMAEVKTWLKKMLTGLFQLHQSMEQHPKVWTDYATELELALAEAWNQLCFVEELMGEQEGNSKERMKEWIHHRSMHQMNLSLSKKSSAASNRSTTRRGPVKEKGETLNITFEMFKNGKTPVQIAAERKVTIGTIEGHFQKLLLAQRVEIKQLLSEDRIEEIKALLQQKNEEESLWQYHQRKGGKFHYGEFQWVKAAETVALTPA